MKQRILVVDDEKSILFAFNRYFGQQGFTVDCARDPKEAAALIENHQYAVAILDLHLDTTERADGLEIAAMIREQSPETVVIILTALGTDEAEHQAAEVGVASFLRKPMRLSHVAEVALGLIGCGAIRAVGA